MPMPMTMSAYPWDLARIGVDEALDETLDAGMQAIEVASNYHTMDVVSPRAGIRMYTSPRGAVLFPVRPSRYGRIKPMTERAEICAAWPAVADGARSRGLTLNAATVSLFQPWIVDAHADCARVLPTGDPVGQSVCPANPDVRDYLAALSNDLADQFGVGMIRFQGAMPAGFDFDWLRSRSIVRFSPVARELLSLCFCPSCFGRGADAGLDVDRLRRLVMDTVAAELEEGTVAGSELAADAELRAFALQFERAATELLAHVRASITASSAPRVSSTAWTPFPLLLADSADDVLAQLVLTVDHISLTPGWFADRNKRIKAVADKVGSPVELGLVIMTLSDAPPRELQEARALGVDDLTLFNWGSLRSSDVREFVTAVREQFG